MTEPNDLNLAWWDERARLHGLDGFYYDVEGFLRGGLAISERERTELGTALGELRGKDVLHVQCHIGLTSLTLARLGARVVGVDFSPVAVERARALSEIAGLDVEFIAADAHYLPAELAGRFDCVFASFGVLMWIANLDAWMSSASTALRDGGNLVLLEGHPISLLVSSTDPPLLEGPYQGGEAVEREDRDYADPLTETENNRAIHYRWGIGDVVTSASKAGLVIEALTEWTDDPGGVPPGKKLKQGPDALARLHVAGADLPLMYSLRARKS